MKHLLYIIMASIFLNLGPGCVKNEKRELLSGTWRGTFKTESGVEIPFNFEVADSSGKKIIRLINAADRFYVDDVTLKNDSVKISIPLFDVEIKATINSNHTLTGNWIKHLPLKDIKMVFSAVPNTKWRFFKTDSTRYVNVSGKWSTLFIKSDLADTTIAIGSFTQTKSYVTGTFLTSTGDYRFLEGTISDKNLYLSSFGGSNPELFTAKLENDSTITNGKYYSGYSSVKNWMASKDENAMLPDAFSLTSLKTGITKINFSFPDLTGKKISNTDIRYKNKVLIIQFLGSWCPNCMDETAFLSSYYKQNNKHGVEVIGLAYERTNDIDKSKRAVSNLKKRFDIPYSVLLTGYTNHVAEVAKSIPELKSFMAFPTTLIIDKKGKVRKIRTGFSGPGTGVYYTEFIIEFEKTINYLLSEK